MDTLIFVCRSALLYCILGFCEDYKHVIINARHELILIRMRNDNNYIVGNPATDPTLKLFKVQWQMPYVALNKINKLSRLRALESRYLSMSSVFENCPLLPNTTWAEKSRDFSIGGTTRKWAWFISRNSSVTSLCMKFHDISFIRLQATVV